MSGHTTERYTRNSGHQPRYNSILEKHVRFTQNVTGPVVNPADETPMDVTSGVSMGWNFPLSGQVTTGPVATLHYDGSTTFTYNEFGDSTTSVTQSDPLQRANMSLLGWQVSSQFSNARPWAQISYNQQFGENIWKVQSGLSRMSTTGQDSNWVDVTIGAGMLSNPHMTTYTALSQVKNSTNNSDCIYTMRVSAKS